MKSYVEALGLVTCDQMEYFILCFAADLRENAPCFIDLQAVQAQLYQLICAFPALVKVVQGNISLEQVTRVLRTLLKEQISIRDLRSILERMLDYDYIVTDPAKHMILDNRLVASGQPLPEPWLKDSVNCISFIRAGISHYELIVNPKILREISA